MVWWCLGVSQHPRSVCLVQDPAAWFRSNFLFVSVLESLLPAWETRVKFRLSDFDLAQPWQLWAFEE